MIFRDTFTETSDTLLASHVPDLGTGWSIIRQIGGSPTLTVNAAADNVQPTTATGNGLGVLYTADATYPTADYEVETVATEPDSLDDPCILAVRIQDAQNMYALRFNTTNFRLYKCVTGAWTALGTDLGSIVAAGLTVRLRISGQQLIAYVGDTLKVELTVTDHSAAGKAGLGMGAVILAGDDLSTQKLDTFQVDYIPILYSSALAPTIGFPGTRPAFKHGDYEFCFYSDGTDLKYKACLNGTDWPSSATTAVTGVTDGRNFGLLYDGNDVYVAYCISSTVYVRKGTISGATITFGTAYTVQSTYQANYLVMIQDALGYYWVGIRDSANSYGRVSRSQNKNDITSWNALQTVFNPVTPNTTHGIMQLAPGVSGYVIATTYRQGTGYYVSVYDPATGTWSTPSLIHSTTITMYAQEFALVTTNDGVCHLVCKGDSNYYYHRTASSPYSSWSAPTTCYGAAAGQMTLSKIGNNLVMFLDTGSDVKWKNYVSGTWDSGATLFVTEDTTLDYFSSSLTAQYVAGTVTATPKNLGSVELNVASPTGLIHSLVYVTGTTGAYQLNYQRKSVSSQNRAVVYRRKSGGSAKLIPENPLLFATATEDKRPNVDFGKEMLPYYEFAFTGNWGIDGDSKYTATENDYATISFTGYGIVVVGKFGLSPAGARNVEAYVDDVLVDTGRDIMTWAQVNQDRIIFAKTYGTSATRTLKLKKVGTDAGRFYIVGYYVAKNENNIPFGSTAYYSASLYEFPHSGIPGTEVNCIPELGAANSNNRKIINDSIIDRYIAYVDAFTSPNDVNQDTSYTAELMCALALQRKLRYGETAVEAQLLQQLEAHFDHIDTSQQDANGILIDPSWGQFPGKIFMLPNLRTLYYCVQANKILGGASSKDFIGLADQILHGMLHNFPTQDFGDDEFNRANQSGWGGSWTVVGTDYGSILSNEAKAATTGADDTFFELFGTTERIATRVTAKMRASSSGCVPQLVARYKTIGGLKNFYMARQYQNELQIYTCIDDVLTKIASVANTWPGNNTDYYLTFYVTGTGADTRLFLHYWPASGSDFTPHQLGFAYNNTEADLDTAGKCGFRIAVSNGQTVYVDDFTTKFFIDGKNVGGLWGQVYTTAYEPWEVIFGTPNQYLDIAAGLWTLYGEPTSEFYAGGTYADHRTAIREMIDNAYTLGVARLDTTTADGAGAWVPYDEVNIAPDTMYGAYVAFLLQYLQQTSYDAPTVDGRTLAQNVTDVTDWLATFKTDGWMGQNINYGSDGSSIGMWWNVAPYYWDGEISTEDTTFVDILYSRAMIESDYDVTTYNLLGKSGTEQTSWRNYYPYLGMIGCFIQQVPQQAYLVDYTVPGLATTVSRELSLLWDQLATVAKESSLLWDVRTLASKENSLLWDMRALTSKELSLLWDLAGPVAKELSLLWDIRTNISKENALLWDTRINANKELSVLWDVRALVNKELQLVWDTTISASLELLLLWDVLAQLNTVAVELGLLWDTQELVSKELVLPWDTRVSASKELSMLYDILALASQETQLVYDVRAPVGKELKLVWDVRKLTAKEVQLLWNVISNVTLGLKLTGTQRVVKSLSGVQAVTRSLSGTQRITKSLSGKQRKM